MSLVMNVARFGGQAFDCISTSDGVNVGVVEHVRPRRNGARLQDMGNGPRRTRLRCLFFETPPDGDDSGDTYFERYETFYRRVTSGETQLFVHPMFGSYRAKVVGEVTTSVDSESGDAISVECTFVEDGDQSEPFDSSASQPVNSASKAVSVEADIANQALADAGLSSSAPTETATAVDAWASDETVSVRKVNLELQSLSNKISSAVDELELATDLSRQPIWRSFQRLQGQLRRAAEFFRQRQPQIFTFTVVDDTPLRVLVTDMYGASEADQRYAELMRLNDIDDPLLIRGGTRLQAQSPQTARGQGLRSAL